MVEIHQGIVYRLESMNTTF